MAVRVNVKSHGLPEIAELHSEKKILGSNEEIDRAVGLVVRAVAREVYVQCSMLTKQIMSTERMR